MKSLIKFAMLAFAFAGTAFAQAPTPKTFSTPQQEQTQKYELYINVSTGDGQSGVAAKLVSQVIAKIKTVDSVQVKDGLAETAAPSAVEFHFLSVETGDTTGAVDIAVVFHAQGVENQLYFGSIIVPVSTDTVDDLTEGLFSALGRTFAQILAGPPTLPTPTPSKSAPSNKNSGVVKS